MWVFTTSGYVSIVDKAPNGEARDETRLMVRSRDLTSITNFLDLGDADTVDAIFSDFPSDYIYRAYVPRDVVTRALVRAAAEIDYDNFKTRAGRVRSASFVGALGRVWAATLSMATASDQAANEKAWDRVYTRR